MKTVDEEYCDLIWDCLQNGETITTRNSEVKRTTARTVTFKSTPLVGVRKTSWRSALREWEWIDSGSNNINDLHPSVKPWWEPWASKSGEIYFNYGEQLRRFTKVDPRTGEIGQFDQIEALVEGIKKHPYSRRNIITTWNPAEMADPLCPLTNCHNSLTQAFVGEKGLLSLVTYQRSCDLICGVPHNWIQMAAFHLWLAAQTGRRVGELTWIGGDIHVYNQHYELAQKIVDNAILCKPTPILALKGEDAFKADNFYLEGEYEPVLMDKAVMVV